MLIEKFGDDHTLTKHGIENFIKTLDQIKFKYLKVKTIQILFKFTIEYSSLEWRLKLFLYVVEIIIF